MRLRPLLGGEILLTPGFSVLPPGRLAVARALLDQLRRRDARWAPVPAYLIEHPRVGPVLVDTAYSTTVAADPGRTLGASARLFEHRPYDLDALLAEAGVRAADVGTVLMTHLHSDHASGLDRFPDATIVADVREWEAGLRGGTGTSRGGYVPAHLARVRRRRYLEFGRGRSAPLGPLHETLDVFGDGSVIAISTPGHTPGHVSLLVRTGTQDVLLLGDAAHVRRQLDHPAPMVAMSDRGAFLATLEMLRAYVRLHPQTVVIPGHDPQVWPTLARVYGG